MDLTIYEDQTGLMLFPEEKLEKNNKIVNFFNNNIDLYLQKAGNNLTIYCHLIAYKVSARPLGYYIICQCRNEENIFSDFKKELNDILKKLELKPRYGHADNVIFENLEKFDNRNIASDYLRRDIDKFAKVLRRLDYFGGDISQISAFCGYALENIDNIEISISEDKSEFGNINILLNKNYADPLKRLDSLEYETPDRQTSNIKHDKQEDKLDNNASTDDIIRETNSKFFKIVAVVVILSLIIVYAVYIKNNHNLPIKDDITKIKESIMMRLGLSTPTPTPIAIPANVAPQTTILTINITPAPTQICATYKPNGECLNAQNGSDNNVSSNITGFVLSDNKTISNVIVWLYDSGNNAIDKNKTDKNGFYTFNDIKDGTYNVSIDERAFTVNVSGRDVTNTNITIKK